MATSISINTIRDTSDGVNDFYTSQTSSATLTNNLVKASTIKRIVSDSRLFGLVPNNSIPISKLQGTLIATQSLSGAIGKDLNPAKNGELAWYTITPENLAYKAFTWTSDKKFGINVTSPEDNLHVAGGINISGWSTLRTTDGNGRVSWYGNATTKDGNPGKYLNSEKASRITQSLGDIIFYRSSDATQTAGSNINWSETMRINDDGSVNINSDLVVGGTVTSVTSLADTFNIENQGSIYYDSGASTIAFKRSTTKILDLFTTKAIFYKENMTLNSQGNRVVSNGYGVFDRITSNNNTLFYRFSSTTLSSGQGNAQRDIMTVTLGNSRVGFGGDPDSTSFSARVKIYGSSHVTGNLKVDGDITGNISTINTTGSIVGGSIDVSSGSIKGGSLDAGSGQIKGGSLDVGSGQIKGGSLNLGGTIVEANDFVPTGAIMAFYRSSAPSGWLKCDGSNIPTQYSALRNLIGTKTPDLRGYFIRGQGTNSDGTSSGNLGAKQGAYAGFNEFGGFRDDGDKQTGDRGELTSFFVNGVFMFGTSSPNSRQYTLKVDTQPGDTRPNNIAFLYCIKT